MLGMWTGFIWLRRWPNDGLWRMR